MSTNLFLFPTSTVNVCFFRSFHFRAAEKAFEISSQLCVNYCNYICLRAQMLHVQNTKSNKKPFKWCRSSKMWLHQHCYPLRVIELNRIASTRLDLDNYFDAIQVFDKAQQHTFESQNIACIHTRHIYSELIFPAISTALLHWNLQIVSEQVYFERKETHQNTNNISFQS